MKSKSSYLQNILSQRNLPPLVFRDKMLDILQQEEYGYLPPLPEDISFAERKNTVPGFCDGKATLDEVQITVHFGSEQFSFPVYCIVPATEGEHPFFVHLGFSEEHNLPVAQIADSGFALLFVPYHLVTADNADFTDGLAGFFTKDGSRGETSPGKIALWAWAAQRALDYAYTRNDLDVTCAIVNGHSRLGKAALFAAATDIRFCGVHSNSAGCSGDAITRGKEGERVADICDSKRFHYWFCPAYRKYMNNEDAMPFDQHYLLASIAPRPIYICAAAEDSWADPLSQFLACLAADGSYNKMGLEGFVCEDRTPVPGDVFAEGLIGYQLRNGKHELNAEDWEGTLAFFRKHLML